jgi:hypothetical protein
MSEIIYRAFISSTKDDLIPERRIVQEAVIDCECFPAAMEQFAASDDDQWTYITREIERCDFYIVIVGGRYGSCIKAGARAGTLMCSLFEGETDLYRSVIKALNMAKNSGKALGYVRPGTQSKKPSVTGFSTTLRMIGEMQEELEEISSKGHEKVLELINADLQGSVDVVMRLETFDQETNKIETIRASHAISLRKLFSLTFMACQSTELDCPEEGIKEFFEQYFLSDEAGLGNQVEGVKIDDGSIGMIASRFVELGIVLVSGNGWKITSLGRKIFAAFGSKV